MKFIIRQTNTLEFTDTVLAAYLLLEAEHEVILTDTITQAERDSPNIVTIGFEAVPAINNFLLAEDYASMFLPGAEITKWMRTIPLPNERDEIIVRHPSYFVNRLNARFDNTQDIERIKKLCIDVFYFILAKGQVYPLRTGGYTGWLGTWLKYVPNDGTEIGTLQKDLLDSLKMASDYLAELGKSYFNSLERIGHTVIEKECRRIHKWITLAQEQGIRYMLTPSKFSDDEYSVLVADNELYPIQKGCGETSIHPTRRYATYATFEDALAYCNTH